LEIQRKRKRIIIIILHLKKEVKRERERFSFFSLGAVTEKFITDHEPMLQISGWEMSSTHLNLSSRGPLALL
jgi:hypothetical protein